MIDTLFMIFKIIISVIIVLNFTTTLIIIWLCIIDDIKERIDKRKEEKYHERKK